MSMQQLLGRAAAFATVAMGALPVFAIAQSTTPTGPTPAPAIVAAYVPPAEASAVYNIKRDDTAFFSTMFKIRELKTGDRNEITRILKENGQEDLMYLLEEGRVLANGMGGGRWQTVQKHAMELRDRGDSKSLAILISIKNYCSGDVYSFAKENDNNRDENGQFNLSQIAGMVGNPFFLRGVQSEAFDSFIADARKCETILSQTRGDIRELVKSAGYKPDFIKQFFPDLELGQHPTGGVRL